MSCKIFSKTAQFFGIQTMKKTWRGIALNPPFRVIPITVTDLARAAFVPGSNSVCKWPFLAQRSAASVRSRGGGLQFL